MVEEGRPGSRGAGFPWSAALDPAANMRVLGDIQRRGLDAAGEIVERLVAAVDGDDTAHANPGDDAQAEGGSTDLDSLVDLWAVLAKRSLHALVRLAASADAGSPAGDRGPSGAAPGRVVTVDVVGGSAPEALRLTASRARPVPGDSAAPEDEATPEVAAEVWLHNGTAEPRSDIRLHCSELRAHDGSELRAEVVFEPEVIEQIPARSSRGVVVAVRALDDGAVAGVYRGVVLAAGLPDVWLAVEVLVEP